MKELLSGGLFWTLVGPLRQSWIRLGKRIDEACEGTSPRILVAFWLFGLVNNVSCTIIISAALDLVGPSIPKSIVLFASILPAFFVKLLAPYFIFRVPYSLRIFLMWLASTLGMLSIALTPPVGERDGALIAKLAGVVLASLSNGLGEMSLLALTHYYGSFSLAAWSSGTGAAGLIGAGLYVMLTSTFGITAKRSLLVSATLPFLMPLAYFLVLPRDLKIFGYTALPQNPIEQEDLRRWEDGHQVNDLTSAADFNINSSSTNLRKSIKINLRRLKSLFIPYKIPLFLVYMSEYLINQGLTPILLFPLDKAPFKTFRSFYPTYAFIYQLGAFISRSSSPFLTIHSLYTPSLLQVLNLLLLTLHAMYFFLPSIYIVFCVIFWEGLLGGVVYINTFSAITRNKQGEDREWSLGAASVSDSAGIVIASLLGMVMEPWLCQLNVRNGRPWCQEAIVT